MGTLYHGSSLIANNGFYSALMTLYEFGSKVTGPINEDCTSSAVEFLTRITKEVVNMAKLLSKTDTNDLVIFSPFVLHSVFKTAAILSNQTRYITQINIYEVIEPLKRLLRIASTRWLAAGMFIELAKPVSVLNIIDRYLKLLLEGSVSDVR